MTSILCDINIFLDIFLRRRGFFHDSAAVLELVETKKCKGYISAISFPILFYLLSKELGPLETRLILKKIRIIFHVARVDEGVIDLALTSNFKDFEDAIQYYSAYNAKATYIVTNNVKDFIASNIPVITPKDLLILENE